MRVRRCLFVVALFAGSAAGCLGGPGRLDPRTATFPEPAFSPPVPVRRALAGGVPVLLLEDHDVPLVRLYLASRGGALYDPPEKAGLAEVAQLAWRTGGAGALAPEAFDRALEDRAVDLSIELGRENTWVRLSALSGDLEAALGLLADVMLRPAFRPERVAWAVGQVAERLRREDDDPDTLAFRELRRALYAGHPRGVVPTVETVRRVDRGDVVALWRRLVDGGDWVIGAVGDFRADALVDRLEAYVGGLPADGGDFPRLPPPAEPRPRRIVVPKDLPQATLVWGRLGPGRTDPDFYALDLLDHAVGSGGFQARLVREIRSNRGLAYSVGSFYQALRGFGVLGTFASTRADAAGQVDDLVRELLDGVARDGLGEDELERARQALLNRHVFRYDDPALAVTERLGLILEGLPEDLPARYPQGIQAVDRTTVDRVAARYYRPGVGVTVVVGPVAPESFGRAGGPAVEVRPP